MKIFAFLLVSAIAAGGPGLAGAGAASSAGGAEGLQLSVQKNIVEAGAEAELDWEIVPNSKSSVAIILGVVLPNGHIYCYGGPKKGFSPLESMESATRIVTDFPFNTAMSGQLKVTLPTEWPKGTYQFIAAVMDAGTVIEIDHSNCFSVQ